MLHASTQSVVPDTPQHIICQLVVVGLMLTGQLSGNEKPAIFQHALNRHTAVLVVLEAIGHDGVRNLVADFIGMAVADLLTGDYFTHGFCPRFHVITKQATFAVA